MIKTPIELENRVRVIDGFTKHNLEEGVVKEFGPLGTVWVQLNSDEEGRLTLFVRGDLRVIA